MIVSLLEVRSCFNISLRQSTFENSKEGVCVMKSKVQKLISWTRENKLVVVFALLLTLTVGYIFIQNAQPKKEERFIEVTEEIQYPQEENEVVDTKGGGIDWPSVFPSGPIDDDGDGIDDRYRYRRSREGIPLTDSWVYKTHPKVGRIAFPLNSKRGIYRGERPPLPTVSPDFGPEMRWIHLPLGDIENGKFVHYPGLRSKSGVQVAWVVVEYGSQIPVGSRMRPQKVVTKESCN